jgi:hypothetical protein
MGPDSRSFKIRPALVLGIIQPALQVLLAGNHPALRLGLSSNVELSVVFGEVGAAILVAESPGVVKNFQKGRWLTEMKFEGGGREKLLEITHTHDSSKHRDHKASVNMPSFRATLAAESFKA